jgi:hypothetical protein
MMTPLVTRYATGRTPTGKTTTSTGFAAWSRQHVGNNIADAAADYRRPHVGR